MSTSGPELRPVVSIEHAQLMRSIRNECRDYMTNNPEYIGYAAQNSWWHKIFGDPSWHPYLLWEFGVAVGYGIIRVKDRKWWITGGIAEKERGKGLGRALFARLTDIATDGHASYLEVLKTNERAVNLYQSLGYSFIGVRDINEGDQAVLIMRADPS